MFTALIPGFRDVRTALTSGVLLLACLWLTFGSAWSEYLYDDADQVLRDLFDFYGPTGRAVLVGALAYVVGTVWASLTARVRNAIWFQYLASPGSLPARMSHWFRPYTTHAKDRVRRHVDEILDASGGTVSAEERDGVARLVLLETLYLGPKLLYVSPEAFAEYERERSEGEFRDAIWLPLLVALLLAVSRSGAGPALALTLGIAAALVSFVTVNEARMHTKFANSQLAHAIADESIRTAALIRVEKEGVDVVLADSPIPEFAQSLPEGGPCSGSGST